MSLGNGQTFGALGITFNPGTGCTAGVDCVRDVSIGKFGAKWLSLFTCADSLSNVHQFCMTTSTTLYAWTNTQFVDTTSLSGTLSNWSPSWYRNPNGTVYLDGSGCPHISFVGTNGTTSFKIYETHPTNNCSDPSAGGTTWSTPTQLVVDTETQTYLDGSVTCISGSGGACTGTGDTFYLWYAHLVVSTSQLIQYATATTAAGAYTRQSAGGDWLGLGLTNEEGPYLYCTDQPFSGSCSSGHWRLLFDNVGAAVGNVISGQLNYTNCTGCGAQAFTGGTWSSAASIVTSVQAKHGSVIPYP